MVLADSESWDVERKMSTQDLKDFQVKTRHLNLYLNQNKQLFPIPQTRQ